MRDKIVETMNSRYSYLAGKDVVLYGMGEIASALIDCKDGLVFRIVGVMDRVIAEGEFKGVKVINIENVRNVAKVIIIAAATRNNPLIYDRISYLEDEGVEIYFSNGEKPGGQNGKKASEYFIETRERLIPLIDAHDVISFDVFDTLVMRRCIFPVEVFNILEERRGEQGFAEKRKNAEKAAFAVIGRLPTIFDIYEHMGLEHTDAVNEIELEKEMLVARGDMMPYFRYAIERNKTVILTSDMYLPSSVLGEMLAKCGILGYVKLYVSCDLGKRKRDGSIWDELRKKHPTGSMLHIGDNAVSDNATYPGVTSYIVKDTVEAARTLGYGEALGVAASSSDFFAIGTSLARLLSLDLTNTDSGGRIIVENAEDIGYCFIAPITLGFVTWLAQTAAANNEEKLYFCARDTYMPMRLYNKIRERYNSPPAEYLYISKRVLCGALAKTLSGIKKCLEYYFDAAASDTTVNEAIFRLFGARLPEDEFTTLSVKQTDYMTVYKKIKESYFKQIQSNAAIENRNFLSYLIKSGIDSNHAAIVDYYAGQSVELSRHFFDGNIYLYGLTANTKEPVLPDNKCYRWDKETINIITGTSFCRSAMLFLESVYSCAEGTCLYFGDNGEPVLNKVGKEHAIRDSIYKGVEAYCGSINETASFEVSRAIYHTLFFGNYAIDKLTEAMKTTNYIQNKGE